MKQLLQDQRTGEMLLADLPSPAADERSVIIQNAVSLLMTEIQPQTFNKSYLTFGGSCSGTVIAIGKDVQNFQVGDRVACYNAKSGVHAELVHVPNKQVVVIPEKISYQEAAFLYPYMLCLSAHELADVGLGSVVFVFGMDLIGQLLCQVLRSSGVHVIVADAREEYVDKLREQGIEAFLLDKNFSKTVFDALKDITLDAVFFAPSFSYIQRSLDKLPSVRKVILFNSVRDMIPRAGISYHMLDINKPFDLSQIVSGGNNPVFTKSLHMLFRLIETGRIQISDLVPHRYSISDISRSSKMIAGHLQQPFHAVLLIYPQGAHEQSRRIELKPEDRHEQSQTALNMGLIFTGEQSRFSVFDKLSGFGNICFRTVSSPTGIRALEFGKLYGFDYCTTNPGEILNDREIGALVVLNEGMDDLDLCMQAISTQKKIFFECLVLPDKERLNQLIQVYQNAKATRNLFPQIMIGFFRRYTVLIKKLKDAFQERKSALTLN
ncbi:MAG: hypothetical protein Q8Q33_09965, partial [Chlamydiota bacterium]|nr:hypothetical protein [Chlamydiota bacterium]